MHSHRSQLIATAVAASVATVGAVLTYQKISRRQKREELREEVLRAVATQDAKDPNLLRHAQEPASERKISAEVDSDLDEGLIREQLARNYALFGDDGMEKLRGGSVVVVGCGGVGSWAAVMLVRS